MNLTQFQFDSNEVRAIVDESGAPWFVAADIAAALQIGRTDDAVRRLDDDEKGTDTIRTPGGDQRMTVVNESGLYSMILTSRKPEAKRFKKWVTSEVLPSIRRTGRYEAPEVAPVFTANPAAQAIQIADALATMLRVSNSGRLSMARQALGLHSPENLPLVPAYAIDAPLDSAAGSSEVTHSASHLLRQHGIDMTAREFNLLAEDAGFIETLSRQSSRGLTKHFKSVTAEGLRYGKNVSTPHSPRETQPHWYDSRFEELLEEIGIMPIN